MPCLSGMNTVVTCTMVTSWKCFPDDSLTTLRHELVWNLSLFYNEPGKTMTEFSAPPTEFYNNLVVVGKGKKVARCKNFGDFGAPEVAH